MFLIDASYLTFKCAGYPGSKKVVSEWADKGAMFFLDDPVNSRMVRYPWYKANRTTLDPRTAALKVLAKELQLWLTATYPNQCMQAYGHEGDDLIAYAALNGPDEGHVIIGEDKDFLQLCGAWLWTVHGDPWGIERLHKKTKLPLKQGRRFLAWQLLYGDLADNIPRRLFSKDLYTGPYVFSTDDPLSTAIEMLPEQQVRESLDVLLLPSPLLTGRDPIDQALEIPT